MTRSVSDKEKKLIHDKLVFYKSQMSIDCIIEVVHGLTNEVLIKLVQSSYSIFTPDDVMKKFQYGQLIKLLKSVKLSLKLLATLICIILQKTLKSQIDIWE